MDDAILITELNDFIFCPASIYFHKMYRDMDRMIYQCTDQINGTAAHENVDTGRYSTSKDILMGMDVFCEKYNLVGKIDIFDVKKKILRERKKRIVKIYDGYIFQVYGQYYALKEMGYEVLKIELYSMDDHKSYGISLPEEDSVMFAAFEHVIESIKRFSLDYFVQDNREKCRHCIYEPACDKSLI